MIPERCVEIFGDSSYGSGYALTETGALTALHVVVCKSTNKPYKNLRVRLVRDAADGDATKRPARIAWQDSKRDLAIIVRDDGGRWPDVTMPEVGELRGHASHTADAAGFPRFRSHDGTRDLFPANGHVRRSVKSGSIFLSIPHNTPRDPEQWSGFSGSASSSKNGWQA